MLFKKKEKIRSAVDDLFLSEMVQEDKAFLILGESDGTYIDDMIDSEKSSIFDNDMISEEDVDIDDAPDDSWDLEE